jgi:hypothetical protein
MDMMVTDAARSDPVRSLAMIAELLSVVWRRRVSFAYNNKKRLAPQGKKQGATTASFIGCEGLGCFRPGFSTVEEDRRWS